MQVNSRKGSRTVKLQASEIRVLEKAADILNELCDLMHDHDAEEAGQHVMRVLKRYQEDSDPAAPAAEKK